jgi:cation transport regulator ChaB
MAKTIRTNIPTNTMDYSKRKALNPLLKWLWDLLSMFSGQAISIPGDFKTRVEYIRALLQDDLSGLVNSTLDFAIDSAMVDYTVETTNKQLTETLNDWLDRINISLKGKVPVGINGLAKEYFRERWKGSSFLLLRSSWENVDGFYLPTKLWFVDGENIVVENGDDDDVRIIGAEKYGLLVGQNKVKSLPSGDDEFIFVQKPYSSWSDLYPTPFIIQRGIYHNLMLLRMVNEKGEKIIAKAIEYLLLMKKGSERLFLEGNVGYDEEDLKKVKEDFKKMLSSSQSEPGTPTYTTNFDTQMEHFIPDYSKVLQQGLYTPIEKRLLQGLGLIEIVEGTSSTRKESILNPKPFIAEVSQGIEDFKQLLVDIMLTIEEKNTVSHRKYFGEKIHIHNTPVKNFITDSIKEHLRSMYDRGLISKQTYTEVAGENVYFDVEIERRKKETEKDLDKHLYPPIIQNQEGRGFDIEGQPIQIGPSPTSQTSPTSKAPLEKKTKETVPPDKKGIEKKNYKATEDDEEIEDEDEVYAGNDEEFIQALEEFSKIFEQAPYSKNTDLPPAVKKYPSGAQTAFRKSWMNAYKHYKDEKIAFKVAWSVLKKWISKNK